ncbi:hypothetical protein VNO80_19286 [Phaseolus coccineus]|uniref:Uncharacterized protein n=1 Tax=Phaseolus coccineus TaxID=3886 RepID=A0AAN9MFV5_PHACN
MNRPMVKKTFSTCMVIHFKKPTSARIGSIQYMYSFRKGKEFDGFICSLYLLHTQHGENQLRIYALEP